MQIVIEIDEEEYEKNKIARCDYHTLRMAIITGTPIPKGHGKIMDVDKIIKKMEEREEQLRDYISMYETSCVETALDMFGETIIEADKGE